MTFGCGCREISRTPIEFKIESCPQVHVNCGPLLPNTNDEDFDKLQNKIICDFKKVIKQLECGIQPDIEIILEEISLLFMNGCGYNVAKKMYSTDIEDDYFLRHDNFLSEFNTQEEKDQVLINLGIYDKLRNFATRQDLDDGLKTKFGYVGRLDEMYYAFASYETYRQWIEEGINTSSELILGKWEANNYIPVQYTITFYTGNGYPIEAQIVTKGYSKPLPTPIYPDNTRIFDGWYENSDYTGTKYLGEYTPNGNITLYAKWNKVKYTLNFYSNYGDNSFTTLNPDVEDVISFDSLSRAGYSFIGWNTQSDGNGDLYQSGSSYTVSQNQDFYAQWLANTYTIHFNGNGSTSGEMSDQILVYDQETNLNINVFTRIGYNFVGWSTEIDGDVIYTDEQNIQNLTSGITLYAKWQPIVYTITYILNNGTFVTDKNSYTIESETITLDTPNRTGYTFQGWYDNINSIGEPITNIITGSTNNKIFYAKWQINTYLVTFVNGQTSSSIPADYGTLLRNIAPVIVEPKVGYLFNGWHINQNGTGDNIESVPDHPITLYAQWEKRQYIVNFVDNYGNNTSYQTTVYYEETINDSPTYTRTGYTFVGWTELIFPDDVATSSDVVDLSNYLVRDNITLHACWKSNVYNITFNPNFNNAQSTIIQLNYGQTIMTSQPIRQGYIFVEWNTAADGSGTRLENNTQATQNITYYAQWEQANRYKLSTTIPQSNNIEWSTSNGEYTTLGQLEGWNDWKNQIYQYLIFPYNNSNNIDDYFEHIDAYQSSLTDSYIKENTNIQNIIVFRFDIVNIQVPLGDSNQNNRVKIK